MKRNAFTLFELMIVVILIGTVYALVLSNFNTKKKVQIFKVANIKNALLPYWSKGKRLDFYLYDNCKESALFINDIYKDEIETDIEVSEFNKIEIYKPDYRGEATKVEFTPIMIENKLKKVCFQYTLFPNGSNSSYIVKIEKEYYIFYPYFQDVNKSTELNEAIDLLEEKKYKGVTPDEIND